MTNGLYRFHGVQPIPYVNRIHPVILSIQKIEGPMRLQSLTFLMTSMRDCSKVGVSPAFENMCISESFQGKRELLAVPCIVSGRVVRISPPDLIIQSTMGPETMNVIISSTLVANADGGLKALGRLEGAWVRMLVLFWYGHSAGPGATLKPEAQMIERLDDDMEAMLDDFTGFVRLRGGVPRADLEARYPRVEPGSCSGIVTWERNRVSWQPSPQAMDDIKTAFNSESDRIRSLRADNSGRPSSYLTSVLQQLDRVKLRAEGLADSIKSDELLRTSLLQLISQQDQLGDLGQHGRDLVRLLQVAGNRATGMAAWMRDVGLVMRESARLVLSPMGREVGVALSKEAVTRSVEDYVRSSGPVFGMLEMCEAIKWPPSLVAPELERVRRDGKLKCATIMGRRFPLVWIREDADASSLGQAQKMSESLLVLVQATLRGYNGLSQAKVVELISSSRRFDNYSAEMILHELQQEGKIELEVESAGTRMWSYPRKNRVMDVLTANPGRMFTLPELTTAAGVALADSIDVYAILKDLEKRQAVSEVREDIWTVGTGPSVFERILRYQGSEFVRSDLKQKGAIRYVWLVADVVNFLQAWVPEFGKKWGIRWSAGVAREKAEDILYAMISDGVVERDGETCRLSGANPR